jgi:hypothetical protein
VVVLFLLSRAHSIFIIFASFSKGAFKLVEVLELCKKLA